MPEFFFQQYASRDARGHRWRDGGAVPQEWQDAFFDALRKSGIFPADGRQLKRREGGVFLASGNTFGAVFAFSPAPPDFSGRSGGVVTDVLFFDVPAMRGKSLKKAWNHPCLTAGPADSVPERVAIFADTDFAGTEAERQFFALADRRETHAVMVPYAMDRFAPIPLEPRPAPQAPPASPASSIPSARTSRTSYTPPQTEWKSCDGMSVRPWMLVAMFCLGFLAGGIITSAGLLLFISAKNNKGNAVSVSRNSAREGNFTDKAYPLDVKLLVKNRNGKILGNKDVSTDTDDASEKEERGRLELELTIEKPIWGETHTVDLTIRKYEPPSMKTNENAHPPAKQGKRQNITNSQKGNEK